MEPVTNCDRSNEAVANCDQLEVLDTNGYRPVNSEIVLSQYDIESLILTIRGKQVLIDRDIAMLYNVETKVLNQK